MSNFPTPYEKPQLDITAHDIITNEQLRKDIITCIAVNNSNHALFSNKAISITPEILSNLFNQSIDTLISGHYEVDEPLRETREDIASLNTQETLIITQLENQKWYQKIVAEWNGQNRNLRTKKATIYTEKQDLIAKKNPLEISLNDIDAEILFYYKIGLLYTQIGKEGCQNNKKREMFDELYNLGRSLMIWCTEGKRDTENYKTVLEKANILLRQIVGYDDVIETVEFEEQILRYQTEIGRRTAECRKMMNLQYKLHPELDQKKKDVQFEKPILSIEASFQRLMEICNEDITLFFQPAVEPLKAELEETLKALEKSCAIVQEDIIEPKRIIEVREVKGQSANNQADFDALQNKNLIIHHTPLIINNALIEKSQGQVFIPDFELERLFKLYPKCSADVERTLFQVKEHTEGKESPIVIPLPKVISVNKDIKKYTIRTQFETWETIFKKVTPSLKSLYYNSNYVSVQTLDHQWGEDLKAYSKRCIQGTKNNVFPEQQKIVEKKLGKDSRIVADMFLVMALHYLITGESLMNYDAMKEWMRINTLGTNQAPLDVNSDGDVIGLFSSCTVASTAGGLGASVSLLQK